MNILYFTPSDIQVARVDRQCIMKFCEALARLNGIVVNLVTVRIRLSKYEQNHSDIFKLYGVQHPFKIISIPTLLRQEKRKKYLSAVMVFLSYSFFAIYYCATKRRRTGTVVYFKNYLYGLPFILARQILAKDLKLIFEAHVLPRNAFQRWTLSRMDGVVANSNALAKDLTGGRLVSETKSLGIHQGVNLDFVESIRLTKMESRKKLGLPLAGKIAVYTGKVYDGYEEIDYYVETAKLLPEDVRLLIVGGRKDHVERLKKKTANIANLSFQSFVPPSEVYFYMFAADALLLYYAPGSELNRYRSPGKLFDYMAAKSPIVAADYPVLREILVHEHNALLVPKASPPDLTSAILRIVCDEQMGQRLAENAYQEVQNYTWASRAQKIVNFIQAL
jgi:glycosyltransferase involved in cell wall biosynthesis